MCSALSTDDGLKPVLVLWLFVETQHGSDDFVSSRSFPLSQLSENVQHSSVTQNV